jgi:hypothetical protein
VNYTLDVGQGKTLVAHVGRLRPFRREVLSWQIADDTRQPPVQVENGARDAVANRIEEDSERGGGSENHDVAMDIFVEGSRELVQDHAYGS